MSSKNYLLPLALIMAVACQDSQTSEPAGSVEVSTPEVAVVEPLGPQYELDGQSSEVLTDLRNAASYRVLITFKGQEDFNPSTAFTNDTPAMPFKSLAMSAYLVNGAYNLKLTTTDGSNGDFYIRPATDQHTVELTQRCGEGELIANGEVIWSGAAKAPFGDLTLGKGFHNRFWAGTFQSVELEALDVICPTDADASE